MRIKKILLSFILFLGITITSSLSNPLVVEAGYAASNGGSGGQASCDENGCTWAAPIRWVQFYNSGGCAYDNYPGAGHQFCWPDNSNGGYISLAQTPPGSSWVRWSTWAGY